MDRLEDRPGLFRPVRASELSQAERRAASAGWGEWVSYNRGWYVPRVAERSAEQRVLEAAQFLMHPAAVTGWGAMAWRRARWFGGLFADQTPRPVPIATPRRIIRPRPTILLCEERCDPREVDEVDGVRISTAVRATCFEMRYARSLRGAVRALDMACYGDHVSIDEVDAWVAWHPSYTGIEQARLAIPLADENAWSPAEVDLRLDWTEAVGRRPLTNRPLFDLEGRHLGTPDLVDPVTGVVGEYDGPVHLAGSRRAVDLRREGDFREHGLHPVSMVSAERRNQSAFHRRLRAAYAAAARQAACDRRWTLEPPSWWVPTWTVEQRRALDDRDREIWLRYRAW